jgi:hypothetical protein
MLSSALHDRKEQATMHANIIRMGERWELERQNRYKAETNHLADNINKM